MSFSGHFVYAAQGDLVDTLSNPGNTVIDCFDYTVYDRNGQSTTAYNNTGINEFGPLWFLGSGENPSMADMNKYTKNKGPARPGIVSGILGEDGYPVLSEANGGTSLGYLFDRRELTDSKGRTAKTCVPDCDGLFTVDELGYYEFDSFREKAVLDTATGEFTVTEDENPMFFPFGSGNSFIGAHISTEFSIPSDYRVFNPYGEYEDMVFTFIGDDDVWVYIDGILIGDVGGIHNPQELIINFVTGDVRVRNYEYPDVVTTVSTIFDMAVLSCGGGEEGRKAVLGENGEYAYRWRQEEDGSYRTYAPNTYHTMEFFYLERGAGRSNMKFHYNFVSTYDFTAHKSLHRDEEHEDIPLEENMFRFMLTGYPEDGIMPVMPTGQPDGDVIWIPDYLEKDASGRWVPKEGASGMEKFTLIAGNSMDGNVNFGNAYKDPDPNLEPYIGKTFRYVIEELPPEGAEKNSDGSYTYNGSTVFPDENGACIFGGIRYDPRKYFFRGTVSPEGWILKTYYTDDTYSEVDESVVFAGFDNYYDDRAAAVIMAHKSLVDQNGESMELTDDMFTFSLTDVTDSTSPRVITESRGCDSSGLIEFPSMIYDAGSGLPESGSASFIYSIRENIPETKDPNIAYSESEYFAKVEITRSASGEITVSVSYYDAYPASAQQSIDGKDAVFVNTMQCVDVSAKKIWEDGNNADGTRPDAITLTLSNGKTYDLSDENGWSVTVEDLPKYDPSGAPIQYTWSEPDVSGYASSSSVEGTLTTFTNTLVTSSSVRKVWSVPSGTSHPRQVTVTLYMNGEAVKDVVLSDENGWTYTEEGLAKYVGDEPAEYSWKEEDENIPEGYICLAPYTDDEGVTVITNRKQEDPPETGYTGRISLLMALQYLCLVICAAAVRKKIIRERIR